MDYTETTRVQAGAEKEVSPVEGRACGRYTAMEQARRPFLERARESSELTLPYLIPPDGWTGTTPLYTPFQGIGSRGTNNLASKLMLALFPPNSPFARLRMSGKAEDQAKKQDKKLKSKVEEMLADIERKIAAKVETEQLRQHLFEGMKHLIVAGNILLYFPEKEGGVRVFHLDRFVVKRDPSGNLLEIVTKEAVSPKSLTSEFYEKVKLVVGYKGDDKTCDIYTYVYFEKNHWEIFQEVHGLEVPGSRGSYPKTKMPWLALRWTKIDGEDYGRGYIEDHLGDLKSAEGLSQSIVEGSAAAAKVLFLVNPNGVTKAKDIEEAPNGSVRQGNATDITVLQLEKFNDFRIAQETMGVIEKRLSYAFMLNSSVQRQGERVTAEEMRFMIQEIEDGLGGIYSVMSHELQLPLVTLLMWRMEKSQEIPTLPKGTVRPVIVTGLEALGRGHDLAKLREVVGDAIKTWGAEIAAKHLHVDEYFTRLATGAGVDPTGLVKTEEELKLQAEADAQAAQQQMVMEMIQKLGPGVMKTMTDMSTKGPANVAAGTAPEAGSGSDSGGSAPSAG